MTAATKSTGRGSHSGRADCSLDPLVVEIGLARVPFGLSGLLLASSGDSLMLEIMDWWIDDELAFSACAEDW